MPSDATPLQDARRDFARQMADAAAWNDPRFEQAVLATQREDFLPPPPWLVISPGARTVYGDVTRSADPVDLYGDVLVALDIAKGINNGQPTLHAAWIGKLRPQPGETVVHVGAGMGYYTAILARLVAPGGKVFAYGIEPHLAQAASQNLAAIDNAEVRAADAVTADIPKADTIYVNAGIVAPPLAWLDALKPGGRLVFPWRPAADVGLALLVTRRVHGFAVDVFSSAGFIPCIGASDEEIALRAPTPNDAAATRALWLSTDAPPTLPPRRSIAISGSRRQLPAKGGWTSLFGQTPLATGLPGCYCRPH